MKKHRSPSKRRRPLWRVAYTVAAIATVFGCSSTTDVRRAADTADPVDVTRYDNGLQSALRPSLAQLAVSRGVPSGQRSVWLVLKQKPNLAVAATGGNWKARGTAVLQALTNNARSSQANLLRTLQARGIAHKPFWIVNAIKVTADDATIVELSRRSEVARVVEDKVLEIPKPIPSKAKAIVNVLEWNLENIRAPEAWGGFGTRGEGVVVANIDTGVQYDHPALVSQYRGNDGGVFDHGYNWFDPTGICGSTPCDNAGHGTHTMGTIVGDDGGDNQIGVAPGAKWIAAKGCEDLGCSYEALLASGQWVLAPTDPFGANPRPEARPNIVNNSWGGGSGDEFYREIVNAWIAAGIFPVFSNGNWGPYCGSVGSPGDFPESYGVGAYDIGNNIAYFSSRGSSLFGVIKPNISAPGVSVRSSVPGNGYDWYDGTSMAAPHVAGAIALLWSAAPALTGDIGFTRELLGAGAIDEDDTSCGGDPTNNNVWGEGRLDVVSSLELAPIGPTGWLAGIVASPDGLGVTGAKVQIAGPSQRSISTRNDGSFNVRLPVGSYDVSVSAFAYLPQTVTGVQIIDAETTALDFTLGAAPAYLVSGTVVDAAGEPVAGATVALVGTPLPVVETDENGYYAYPAVPVGEYELSVDAGGCYAKSSVGFIVDGVEDVPVTLAQKSDSYGYVCSKAEFDYVEATTQLPIYGFGQTDITLPFTFTYYGESYDKITVTGNGYAAFDSPWARFDNTPLPNRDAPNAGIYPFWDDLYVDYDSGVYWSTTGSAPNRRVVIEWRNLLTWFDYASRVNFEIILHETGEITMQYPAPTDSPYARGALASIGIENESGEVGIQYSYRTQSIVRDTAVTYAVPFAGFVQGTVRDANDGLPVAGVTVLATGDDGTVRKGRTNASGTYRLMLTQGNYVIEASRTNYVTAFQSVQVTEQATATLDFTLGTAKASISPPTVQLVLGQNELRQRTLNLGNQGGVPLQYAVREAGGRRQSLTLSRLRPRKTNVDPNAKTTREVYEPLGAAALAAVSPAAAGDVISSFASPVSFAWGIGQVDNLWLSDLDTIRNYETTTSGQLTGVSYSAPGADWFGDMAFDPTRGLVCQVAIGGNNGIHCWDPQSGFVVSTITGTPWSNISQRGLAYRAEDDTFYVGGWNEGIIYHVAGSSHSSPGQVLSSCSPPDYAISGLAYNPAMNVLWAATNSETDTIYELNPDDCTVLSTLAAPQGGAYQGAGLEMDAAGNLWVVAQSPNKVYLVDSGVPAFSDVSWLSVTPTDGTVAQGASTNLQVTVNTAGLQPGLYLATIFVQSNSGREPMLRVPVSVVISDYRRLVNTGGNAYTDTEGDVWGKDQAHKVGNWGYVQKGTTKKTNQTISGTLDQALYQDLREDPYAYRFDNVPNGIYQIDFRFAELDKIKVGKRLFDVIVEDTVVLPAHDVQYEVGRYAAEARTFFIEVVDGRLDVRLIKRSGSSAPILNALRVTRRPDR
jgi:subtilisin family serine protease